MIIKNDFLNKLKEFGLNSYEGKLWIALLSRGVSTAGELSDISNVPRSRAYDVLESLEKKGFVVVKIGKPIKYLAVPPTEVLERVKQKILEEAEERNKSLDVLKRSEVLDELSLLHDEGIKLIDPTDKTGSFRGRDKAYEHLSKMIKDANKSIILMTSAKGLERKNEALGSLLRKASKRGIDVKIVTSKEADKRIVEEFSKHSKIKTHDNASTRFCIIDDSQVMLFLTHDDKVHQSYDSAVWLEAPQFVNYFSSLFQKEWKNN
jgi:HTH-type transcriptional regulator, sugar sensing transcriptional regulator